MGVTSQDISTWDEMVLTLARKRARINGVEIDDLIQEGRMSVLLCLLGNVEPSETDIRNSMRRWINAAKKQTHVQYDIRME